MNEAQTLTLLQIVVPFIVAYAVSVLICDSVLANRLLGRQVNGFLNLAVMLMVLVALLLLLAAVIAHDYNSVNIGISCILCGCSVGLTHRLHFAS